MRLIDADKLLEILKGMHGIEHTRYDDGLDTAEAVIDVAETIEPVKHGHWVYDGSTSTGDYFKCSECNAHIFLDESRKVSFKHVSDRKRYCHNCGANMGGDNNA